MRRAFLLLPLQVGLEGRSEASLPIFFGIIGKVSRILYSEKVVFIGIFKRSALINGGQELLAIRYEGKLLIETRERACSP